jgi:hypothetical protein
MNSTAINEILSKDDCTKNIFLGVFALDELPKNINYPSCLVFNNQNSYEEGEHWLALHYNENGKCLFFDSYGLSPNNYSKITKYIKNTSRGQFGFNMKRVQGDSEYCGLYCVFYLIYLCHNSSREFFKLFTTDLKHNDKIIKELLN